MTRARDLADLLNGGKTIASATISGDLTVANKIQHDGDTDSFIQFDGADSLNISTGGGEKILINNTGMTVNEDSADLDFRVESNGNANMLFVDGGNDRVGIGTNSPGHLLHLKNSNPTIRLEDSDGASNIYGLLQADGAGSVYIKADDAGNSGSTKIAFEVDGSERARIDSSGRVLIGTTSTVIDTSPIFQVVADQAANFQATVTTSGGTVLNVDRANADGNLIRLRQAGTTEGTISVSGSTVSYNGGHLSRWSQLTDGTEDLTIVKGTVMTNLDQMAVWSYDEVLWTADDELPDGVSVGDVKTAAYTEDNEQLNCMAVSSVEGDTNVAGVFVNWDNGDEDFNDMNVAMTGDMVIRIAQGTTVARGDLLMSAGDGTAKPQGDDIVRSKTIAKVISTNVSHTYNDGSYLVPCVLMAC
jgi:prepilin-type processing-associated H-X9-DG protein